MHEEIIELHAEIAALKQELAAERVANAKNANIVAQQARELNGWRIFDVRCRDEWETHKGERFTVLEVRRERVNNERGRMSFGTAVVKYPAEFGIEHIIPLIDFDDSWKLISRTTKEPY